MKKVDKDGVIWYKSIDDILFSDKKACQQYEKKYWFEYLYTLFDVKELPKHWDSHYFSYSFKISERNKVFLSLFFSLMMEFVMANDGCTVIEKDLSKVESFKKEYIPSKIMKTLKADEDMPTGVYVLAIDWIRNSLGYIYNIDIRILSRDDIEQDLEDRVDDYEKIFDEVFYLYGVY